MKSSKFGLGENEPSEQVDITDIAEICHQLNSRTSNNVPKPYSEYDPESIFPPPSQVSVNNEIESDRSKSQCFVNLWKRSVTCEQKQDKEINFSASKYEQITKKLKKIEVQKLNLNQKLIICEKSPLIRQDQISNKDSIINNNNNKDLVSLNPPSENFRITDFFSNKNVSSSKGKVEGSKQTQHREKELHIQTQFSKINEKVFSIPYIEEPKVNPLIILLTQKNNKKRKVIQELKQELRTLKQKKKQSSIKFSELKNQAKAKLKSKLLETNNIKMQYQIFYSSISSVLIQNELNQRFVPHIDQRLRNLQENKKKGSQKKGNNRKQTHTDEQSIGNNEGNQQPLNTHHLPQKKQYINHWISKLQKLKQKLSQDAKYYTKLGEVGKKVQRASQQMMQKFRENPTLRDYVLLSVDYPLTQSKTKVDELNEISSFNLQSLIHETLTILKFPKFSTQMAKQMVTKQLSHLYKMSTKLHGKPYLPSWTANKNSFYFLQTVAQTTKNSEYLVYGREKIDGYETMQSLMHKYQGFSELMVKYIIRVCLIILEEIKDKVGIHVFLLPLNIYFGPTCDIKFSNILMNNLFLKDEFKPYLSSQKFYYFVPPEGLSQKDFSNAEIWSLGILIYFIIYEAYPFEYESDHNFLKETFWIYNELIFPSKPIVSEKLKDFITVCLTYKEKDLSLLAKHQFLNK